MKDIQDLDSLIQTIREIMELEWWTRYHHWEPLPLLCSLSLKRLMFPFLHELFRVRELYRNKLPLSTIQDLLPC